MSALIAKRIDVSQLSEDPANVRIHNNRNILAIMQSLQTFGQQKPVVVDCNNIVRAGNGTLEAAKRLGWTHLDCCVSSLVGSEMIAYSIADNRTAELAEWDMAQLVNSIQGMQSERSDLVDAIGFTQDEIDAMSPSFEPGTEDDQGQLDQLQAKMVVCPQCNLEFDRREKN